MSKHLLRLVLLAFESSHTQWSQKSDTFVCDKKNNSLGVIRPLCFLQEKLTKSYKQQKGKPSFFGTTAQEKLAELKQ